MPRYPARRKQQIGLLIRGYEEAHETRDTLYVSNDCSLVIIEPSSCAAATAATAILIGLALDSVGEILGRFWPGFAHAGLICRLDSATPRYFLPISFPAIPYACYLLLLRVLRRAACAFLLLIALFVSVCEWRKSRHKMVSQGKRRARRYPRR